MSTFESRPASGWPVFGSLLVAGWIGSFAGIFLSEALLPVGIRGYLVFSLLGSVVAAALLPTILRALATLEVSFGTALMALVAGSIASTLLRQLLLRGLTAPGRAPMPAIGLVSLVPGLIGTGVSYFLLQAAAEPQARNRPASLRRRADRLDGQPPPIDYHEALIAARNAVSETSNLLSRCSPDDWPTRSLDALSQLQLAADRLRRLDPQEPEERVAHDELVGALRELQDEVVQMGRYETCEPSSILRSDAIDRAERAIAALET